MTGRILMCGPFPYLGFNCVQIAFNGRLVLIWSERRRGDYFWFGVFLRVFGDGCKPVS